MTSGQVEIQLIAVVVAVACALPGTFLVLRRLALVSDAISHSILLGIVLGFLITESVTSPLLLVGAALVGLATVVLVQLLERTGLVREDAAIGLVFPALFSIGVILIARYADGVHLDVDAVLLGELAFAPFDRLELLGWDWGPVALVVMGTILVLEPRRDRGLLEGAEALDLRPGARGRARLHARARPVRADEPRLADRGRRVRRGRLDPRRRADDRARPRPRTCSPTACRGCSGSRPRSAPPRRSPATGSPTRSTRRSPVRWRR